MGLLPKYREDLPRVRRFSIQTRVAHWGHALTFFVCFASGMAIFFGDTWLAVPFGGLAGASLVHKIAAVGLTAFILLYVVWGFGSLLRWVREVARFGRRDIAFLATVPGKFFGRDVEVPPQTRLNGGQKLNSVVLSASVLAIVLSGYAIWFPEYFGAGTVRWAYLVHAVAMIIATALALVHGYLGTAHPETGESFWGIWRGTVRADWARKHHSLWLDEVQGGEGNAGHPPSSES